VKVVLVLIQAITMVGLAYLFYRSGQWRLGTAQLLLAAVTAVLYTGNMA
jgi:hypothetical protein